LVTGKLNFGLNYEIKYNDLVGFIVSSDVNFIESTDKMERIKQEEDKILFDKTNNFSQKENAKDIHSGIRLGMGFDFTNIRKIDLLLSIKEIPINVIGGLTYFWGYFDNTGKYEDFTSTFGTENIFGDREDGLVNKYSCWGLGVAHEINIIKTPIYFEYGYCESKTKFFQALYDPLEILGDNGYYYINSTKSNKKESGFFYGIEQVVDLSENLYCGWGLQHIPFSYLPEYNFIIYLGLCY
jgi:hypothetical protein